MGQGTTRKDLGDEIDEISTHVMGAPTKTDLERERRRSLGRREGAVTVVGHRALPREGGTRAGDSERRESRARGYSTATGSLDH